MKTVHMKARFLMSMPLVLVLASCTVGPDFAPPTLVELPESFANDLAPDERSSSVTEAAAIEDLEWWQGFGDADLTALIERAMTDNLEIDIALRRVEEARALRQAQGARLLPAIDASASGGRSRASAQGPGPLAGLEQAGLASLENEQFTFTFDAAWELDLFGRLRRAQEASQARLDATIEDRRALLLTIAAETASTYIEWAGAERRRFLAERNLGLQESSFEVVQGKVDAGLLSRYELDSLRAQLESTRSALPALRLASKRALHRLSVLVGQPPSTLEREVRQTSPIPAPPMAIDGGLPADLLLRRPDIRQAEDRLHAASADLGVAIGDRYPRLTFGGSRGFEAESLADLLESASRLWSIGPRLDLPVFRGGQLSAAVAAARARFRASESAWRLTVLRALEEVETALLAYEESWRRLESLEQAAAAAESASDAARVLFEEGLRDSLALLDAQRSQTLLEDAKAGAESERALYAIALYKALGGGWRSLAELDRAARQEREAREGASSGPLERLAPPDPQ